MALSAVLPMEPISHEPSAISEWTEVVFLAMQTRHHPLVRCC